MFLRRLSILRRVRRGPTLTPPANNVRLLSTGSGQEVLQKVAEFFGLDEKGRRKRAQKKAVKEGVAAAFQGTGLAGRIWASLVTRFATQVLGAFSSSMEDFAAIHRAAENALLRDRAVTDLLGRDIVCQPPFSSSMSSAQANGKRMKVISLVFDVSGDLSSGRVHVTAEIDKDDAVKIKHIRVSSEGGNSVQVNVSSKSSGLRTIIDV